MTHYAQRIVTFLGAALFSIVALSAGSPFDRDLTVSTSEEAIAHYISSCSTVTTPGLRVCQEQPLDFNNDGKTDLILGIGISSPATNKFYAGRGDGSFQSAVFFGPQRSTSGLKVADLDGDGDLDMVESTRGGVNSVYTNDGTGIASFDTAQAIDGRTERSSSVAVGDVDNDGLLDVVISNEGSGGLQSYLVYLNTTTTPDSITFDAAIELDAPGSESWTRRLVLLDAEGDGDLDVVATSASGQADGLGTGNVLYINRTVDGGPGLFDAAIALTANAADDSDEANAVAAGDIDNDGDPDLVFSVWKGPDRYYINNSTGAGPDFETTGTFGPSDAGSTSSQSSNVRLGDLDNDNDLDAAITTYQGDNRIHLNLHDSGGGPGFAAALDIVDPNGLAVDESRGIDLTDLNGDGSLDLLILNRSQLDLRYLNNDTCAGGGNACNPFDNDGPEILSQLATVFIDEDLPFDLLTELDQLEVQDADNVFPADFGVILSTPVGNDEYTCPPNSNGDPFTCEGSIITPNPGYSGPLTVDMKVNDGENSSASFVFNIDVNSLEDAPEFTSVPVTTASESLVYTYNITAEDGDGDAITIDANPDPVPAWLTLTDNGDGTATLTGMPGPADVGDHNITLRVRDPDGDFGTQVFTITVEAGAPTFTSMPLTAAAEGELYSYDVAASDPDAGDTLTITAATALPIWLTLTDNGDGTALLEGTPTGLDVGPHDIELLVEDQGGLSATQPFTITVTAAGEGPEITLDGANPLNVTLGGMFTEPGYTASDPQDGDLTGDVVVTGMVDTSTEGDYTLTYSVEDSAGNAAQVQRTVTVQAGAPGNTAPTITSPGDQTATVGQAVNVDAASGADDADGDTLTFSATGLPASLTLSADGMLTGTPVAADTTNSPYNVTVTVDDGNGGQASASFMLTINASGGGGTTPPPPPPAGGGSTGGGGAFGLLELGSMLFLGVLAGVRRRRTLIERRPS